MSFLRFVIQSGSHLCYVFSSEMKLPFIGIPFSSYEVLINHSYLISIEQLLNFVMTLLVLLLFTAKSPA